MSPRSKASEQRAVDAWNAQHAVGIVVTVKRDDGWSTLTKTRSPATMLSGHTAVIWLEGLSGCYLLDHVTPARAATAASTADLDQRDRCLAGRLA